jgi:Zn-dependent protease with chaperone function
MHLMMLLAAVIWATGWRWISPPPSVNATWSARWQHSLEQFLFPPLLVLMTAVAILLMGPSGQMVWGWEGWLSYSLALGVLGCVVVGCWILFWQGRRTLQAIRIYPLTHYQGTSLRILPVSLLYSAQVGFWRSELVVSQGMLAQLMAQHLDAVLWHEQAHAYYRDTFWFFWLGCVKRLSRWLPNTEALWQELLLLRELRADRWAAQHTDTLLLAEALLQMVTTPKVTDELMASGFNSVTPPERLVQRIDALCTPIEADLEPGGVIFSVSRHWVWILFIFLPWVVIPLHHTH